MSNETANLPDLLPCPFCGGSLGLSKHFKEDLWRGLHRCPVVGAIEFDWDDKDPIVAKWNSRHPASPTTPQPQPAALVEAHSGVLAEVAAERRRQIEVEGWTPKHDDAHDASEMALAAAAYILFGKGSHNPQATAPSMWPWAQSWWKPKDRRRDLIRALALLTAEVERIDRTARQDGQTEGEG